jgi:hypothetical protein
MWDPDLQTVRYVDSFRSHHEGRWAHEQVAIFQSKLSDSVCEDSHQTACCADGDESPTNQEGNPAIRRGWLCARLSRLAGSEIAQNRFK